MGRVSAVTDPAVLKVEKCAGGDRNVAAIAPEREARVFSETVTVPVESVEGQALQQAVEDLVSKRFSAPVRHLRREELIRPKVPQARRRYFRHTLETVEDQSQQIFVFLKSGIGNSDYLLNIENFLNHLPQRDFRSPIFYGLADIAYENQKSQIAVWEFVFGKSYVVSDRLDRDILQQLACVAADITLAAGEASLRVSKLRGRIPFMKPLGEQLEAITEELIAGGADLTSLRSRLRRFVKKERKILTRFAAAGDTFLSHMDYGNGNVVFPPGNQCPVVIDWESVCLGPPGSTLRKFALLDRRMHEGIAETFVDVLRRKGLILERSEVLFMMRATQIFYTLDWGIRRGSKQVASTSKALGWGLRNLDLLEV